VAGEQAGVEDHQAVEAVCQLDGGAQPDRPAPVVDDGGRATQVERLGERLGRLGVAVVRVPADVGWLVRAAEAGHVGGDAAKARVADGRHDLAPQKRPRGLAVEEDDGRPVALVDVRQTQAVPVAVAGLERELRQGGEPLVRRAGDIHPRGTLPGTDQR